ncbi:MAG: toxin-antitoxin system HicB family antitoxin [Candidatus Aminicenantes bacterium]|jgi:antitoxin HicB|nr:toxin-antitoxin system HicB family antitoxin [Candidatus Aminicenantes bacterium]
MRTKDVKYYMNLPYRIVIQKDPYGGFFAEVEELQGCMTQGETYEEAYNNILDAMEGWLEVALERGIAIPEPASESQYSGSFTLRMPRTLHKKLAQHAKKENVSLNQYAIHLLSQREVSL